jgi:uncharacterized protein (DUF4415 family)
MKKEYDFRKATRGQVVRRKYRTRVTIHLDADLLEDLRRRADAAGRGYQTLINEAVREFLARSEQRPLALHVEATVGRIAR